MRVMRILFAVNCSLSLRIHAVILSEARRAESKNPPVRGKDTKKQRTIVTGVFDCDSLKAGFAGCSLARRLRAVSLRSLRMTR